MNDQAQQAVEFPFMGEVEASPVTEIKRGVAALRAVAREFREAVEKHGELVPLATVAEVMEISVQGVQNYIERGRLEAVEACGRRWVVASSAIKLMVEGPRKGGRPRKVRNSVLLGQELAAAVEQRLEN